MIIWTVRTNDEDVDDDDVLNGAVTILTKRREREKNTDALFTVDFLRSANKTITVVGVLSFKEILKHLFRRRRFE